VFLRENSLHADGAYSELPNEQKRWRSLPPFPLRFRHQKKVEMSGVFFGVADATVFSPRLPRIPPRLHQQKTTATKADFPKYPSKTP
jgi:hypothetical protein